MNMISYKPYGKLRNHNNLELVHTAQYTEFRERSDIYYA